MKIRELVIIFGLILLLSEPGYCLFKEDISPQQVISSVRMQRAKDDQRKKQAEQAEKEAALEAAQTDDAFLQSGTEGNVSVDGKDQQSQISETMKEKKAEVQYKRYDRNGQVVATPQPVDLVQQSQKEEKKEKKSTGFLLAYILFMVVIVLVTKYAANKQIGKR